MAQGIITKDVLELSGGPLQVGVGAQIRREQLDNPNQNPANEFVDVNQVFAKGERTVKAAFFEVNAPVLDQLEIQAGGRFESYSTGFSKFSPKIGVKITPIRQIALRGTYSKGFRAPSFAETGDAGVIGFVAATPPCVVRLQHGATPCPTTNAPPATPMLRRRHWASARTAIRTSARKSRATTRSASSPSRSRRSASRSTITTSGRPTSSPRARCRPTRLTAFYNGQPLPAGYSVVTNPVDPDFPAATPVVAIINSPYVNASEIRTSGIDFSALFQKKFGDNIRFSSQLEVTKIIKFDFYPESGADPQEYAGTLGPYQLSSGAGTPR